MKTLHFDYDMQLRYAEEVKKCYFTIKCIPADTARQHLKELEIRIEPCKHWEQGEDSFGNRLLFGRVDESHQVFSFHVTGLVETGMTEYEAAADSNMAGIYRYPYGLTIPGEELRAYYGDLKSCLKDSASAAGASGKSPEYQKGVILMNRLYQDFFYEKNVTGMETSAEEAWKGGKGVCQDYAHIMIALCRMAGIPARYVTGMLIGEGYSHAWVEILADGKWYGLDPTNNLIVREDHIKIGTGRDVADCLINRGLITGGGVQTQTVCVNVRNEGEKGMENREI
ncbi:MAG: transglutaminase family protein [Bacillus sp. (in: Bacteria)]|nr:transglutaminase family protein [Bacillus sp. (in: firmicutes)]MCM1426530.1 transglutaminase family protein [Eubacterium sp.]